MGENIRLDRGDHGDLARSGGYQGVEQENPLAGRTQTREIEGWNRSSIPHMTPEFLVGKANCDFVQVSRELIG